MDRPPAGDHTVPASCITKTTLGIQRYVLKHFHTNSMFGLPARWFWVHNIFCIACSSYSFSGLRRGDCTYVHDNGCSMRVPLTFWFRTSRESNLGPRRYFSKHVLIQFVLVPPAMQSYVRNDMFQILFQFDRTSGEAILDAQWYLFQNICRHTGRGRQYCSAGRPPPPRIRRYCFIEQ